MGTCRDQCSDPPPDLPQGWSLILGGQTTGRPPAEPDVRLQMNQFFPRLLFSCIGLAVQLRSFCKLPPPQTIQMTVKPHDTGPNGSSHFQKTLLPAVFLLVAF